MISKKSGKLFEIVLRWTHLCGGMPFIWDSRKGKVRVTRKGVLRWSLTFIIQTFLGLFTYFRLFQIMCDLTRSQRDFTKGPDPSKSLHTTRFKSIRFNVEISYCFVYAIIYTFLIAISFNTIWNLKDIVIFTNSYLRFMAHFRESYCGRLRRSWKNGCEDVVQVMITLAAFSPLIPTVHYLFNPWHPQYLTSLLISFEEDDVDFYNISYKYGLAITILLIGTFGILQACFLWTITSTLLFMTVNVTISAYVFSSAVKEMTIIPSWRNSTYSYPHQAIITRGQRQRHRRRRAQQYFPSFSSYYATRDKLRTSFSLIKTYRSFQIIQTLARPCFSKIAFITEFLEIVFSALIISVLIHFSEGLSSASIILLIFCLSVLTVLWTFILRIVGKFRKKTEASIESWKILKVSYLDEIKFMKVVKMSCHPITIKAGDILYEMNIKHVPYFLFYIACGAIIFSFMFHFLTSSYNY